MCSKFIKGIYSNAKYIKKERHYLSGVFLQDTRRQRPMPVLMFVHGGSYQNGMGAMFDGSVMATHGIIVVTFNYRLGPLGMSKDREYLYGIQC